MSKITKELRKQEQVIRAMSNNSTSLDVRYALKKIRSEMEHQRMLLESK